MEEIRKEIPWLPEWKYYVSNLWRVKNGKVQNRSWRIMKFERNRYWHCRIKLYWDWWRNDVRHYQVHRLVYCVFNNLDYDYWLDWSMSNYYWLILHKDNNPENNRLDNLYMWTQKDNMQQCIKDWRFSFLETKYWEENNSAILTEDDVRMIRALAECWVKQNLIAECLWASKSTINSIVAGRTWKHVSR